MGTLTGSYTVIYCTVIILDLHWPQKPKSEDEIMKCQANNFAQDNWGSSNEELNVCMTNALQTVHDWASQPILGFPAHSGLPSPITRFGLPSPISSFGLPSPIIYSFGLPSHITVLGFPAPSPALGFPAPLQFWASQPHILSVELTLVMLEGLHCIVYANLVSLLFLKHVYNTI